MTDKKTGRSPGQKRREKARRHRRREDRRAALKAADTTGWTKHSDYHFIKNEDGQRIDWWPSTGKWAVNGVIQLTKKEK